MSAPLEHPVISQTEAAGYPAASGWVYICRDCGGHIYPEEPFYAVAGQVYCTGCMEDMRQYA